MAGTNKMVAGFFRFIYSFILYLLFPLIFVRLLNSAFKLTAYRQRWAERLGFLTLNNHKKIIWLHAVSVGEVIAATPLVRTLQTKYPQHHLMVTCTTPTGSQRIRAVFGDSIEHSYVPYDTPDAVRRFLKRTKPVLLIIMETELWPNTVAACRKRGIPIVLANGRLSQKSARAYKKISPLIQSMLQSINAVAAQHRQDGTRFVDLGLPQQALTISGNIKFDLTIDPATHSKARQLSLQWRGLQNRLVWLAASTHSGEEKMILQAFQQIKQTLAQPPLLVLVPRHPERFNRVATMCQSAGFSLERYSSQNRDVDDADILLGDTMGELMSFYGACDMTFIGGSLVPNGGHNMIEAATWGIPILCGPHLFNFASVSSLLVKGNGMQICHGVDELTNYCIEWLTSPKQRTEIGAAAQQIAEQNRGALDKLITVIDDQLH